MNPTAVDTPATAPPRPPLAAVPLAISPDEPWYVRLRWCAGDAATVTRRYLIHLRSAPERALMALLLPLIFTVLFVYVLGSNMRSPEGSSYVGFLLPGMLAQMTVFGVSASAGVVVEDKEKGVIDRFHSLPMSRAGVPVGQSLAEIIGGAISLLVMAGCGLLVGWRPDGSAAGITGAFLLLVLARYAFSWLGIWLGLVVRSRAVTDLIGMLTFPLTMVSNIFVPADGMTPALRLVAEWNPVSAIVSATRRLFGDPMAVPPDAAWPSAHPVAAALGWCAVLLAVFGPLAVRAFHTPRY
ncbi:ABC transporter permease [Streptomyces formicae]